jgi:hypothetical protein
MRTVMVRYRATNEAKAAENEALVRAVFDELAQRSPSGLRYASYRFDGTSFLHVATVETTDPHPLTSLPAFQRFTEKIKERCVEPPVTTELTPIGWYVSSR